MTLASPSEPKPPHRRSSGSAIAHLAPTLLRLPDLSEPVDPVAEQIAPVAEAGIDGEKPAMDSVANLESEGSFGNQSEWKACPIGKAAGTEPPPEKTKTPTPSDAPTPQRDVIDDVQLPPGITAKAANLIREEAAGTAADPTAEKTVEEAALVAGEAAELTGENNAEGSEIAAPEDRSDVMESAVPADGTAVSPPRQRTEKADRHRRASGSGRAGRRSDSLLEVISSRATLLLALGLIAAYAVFGPRGDDIAKRSADQTAEELTIKDGSSVLAEADLPPESAASTAKKDDPVQLTAPEKFAAIANAGPTGESDQGAAATQPEQPDASIGQSPETSGAPGLGFPATASIGPPITPNPFPLDRSEPEDSEIQGSPFGSQEVLGLAAADGAKIPAGPNRTGTPAAPASTSTDAAGKVDPPQPIFSSTPRGVTDWLDFLPPAAGGSESPSAENASTDSTSNRSMELNTGAGESVLSGSVGNDLAEPPTTRSPNEPNFQLQLPGSPTPAREAAYAPNGATADSPEARVATPEPSVKKR